MKLFFRIIFFLFLLFFSSMSLAEKITEKYLVEVGGLNLGVFVWEVDLTKDKYSIRITLKNKGFLTSLYKFSGLYEVSGIRQNGNILPETYKQEWKTNKKKRYIKIFFNKNKVVKIIQNPIENEIRRIDYNNKIGLKDPLTSFLEILLRKRQSRTIDGRRTYLMRAELNKKNNLIKINIEKYKNIWSDHKRLDLEYIELFQSSSINNLTLPSLIKIKFKGILYKITKN